MSGGVALQPLLFQLNDELIIGSRAEKPDFSKDELFEGGLLSWNSLSAFRLEGRVFVLGRLPKEQGVYECASLASTVRKLFKAHIGAGKGPGSLTQSSTHRVITRTGEPRIRSGEPPYPTNQG